MNVGIIGGGSAGIFAASEAIKRCTDVHIFDNNSFLGRKLSVTGAGRCNITNTNISPSRYHSENDFSFERIINENGYDVLISKLNQLGIFTYHTDDGWVYPISNSARNISHLLEDHLRSIGVRIHLDTIVKKIVRNQNRFSIFTNSEEEHEFDRIIVATGGCAYPQLNASNSILNSIEGLGHKLIPSFPALSPIKTSKNETKDLSGVRTDATIRIFHKKKEIGKEFGNIIFTDWGLNGPGVMNLSHLINNKDDLQVQIDFIDIFPANYLEMILNSENKFQTLSSPFLSILNSKIISAVFKKCNLDPNENFSQSKFNKIYNNSKFVEKITGNRGFEFSQISSGGVDSSMVNNETLESTICPGLYFAGEILDVMGPCGGFNLHWAFISGMKAGKLEER